MMKIATLENSSRLDTVSYYSGIRPDTMGDTTWTDAIKRIKSDRYKRIIKSIQAIEDPREKRKAKTKLPSVTFGGTFDRKRDRHSLQFPTGFIVADLDHLPDVKKTFNELKKDEHIFFAFISPSGDGIKAGLRSETVSNDTEHKQFYAAVEKYFKDVYQVDIDPACKDISRLTFMSHDPGAYIAKKACYFDHSEFKEPEPATPPPPAPTETTPRKQKYGRKVLESACHKIRDSQPGEQHHIRVEQATLVGGFIPTGYLTRGQALSELEQAVGASGAENMKASMQDILDGIKYGESKPLDPIAEADAERQAIQKEPKPEPEPAGARVMSDKKSSENLTQKLRDYIGITVGIFTTREVYDDFSLNNEKEKDYARTVLRRLAAQGVIERIKNKAGTWRKVDSEIKKMDLINVKVENVDLSLPLQIDNFVIFHPGNIVLVGGDTNSGKTAFLMNIAKDNIDDFAIHYFSSEMGPQEMRARTDLFNEFPLDHPNFNSYERTEDFADVIFPGRGNLNIIDYIELVEDHWKIAKYLKEIHEKLDGALAVVAVQKKSPQSDDPLGGKRGLEKPRLVLAMRNGRIKIVKAKNWKTGLNPNGMQADFKLVQGCKFLRQSEWARDDFIHDPNDPK